VTSFKTVDEYIASFPPETQAVLKQLRRTVKNLASQAEEKIAYGMAGYKLYGKPLVYFGGWKEHVGIYGLSGAMEAYKLELRPYAGPAGALRFPLSKPLPLDLISDVLRFQTREIRDKAGTRKGARTR